MGCGASNAVAVSPDIDEFTEYRGYGADYIDYSYYESYFTEPSKQEAWKDYRKNALQYQTEPKSPTGDAYNLYEHWCDNQPSRHSKVVNYELPNQGTGVVVKETEDTVRLVIERSNTDIKRHAKDEMDPVAGDSTKLRMGLKTVSTALRITIIPQKQAHSTRPNSLNVTVLDTLRKPSAGFLTDRPRISEEKHFVDFDFPPDQALGKYVSTYDWKRPREIYPDKEICLFHNGTSLDDIDQGIFGTCYFLATLAGLATQPSVMKQIILTDAYNIEAGVFHCRFWRLGKWVDIYTDDYLPCNDGGLVGCKSKDYVGEMWVPLIEKAYAKFMCSYPDIEGGTPRDAYLALTGGCAEWLALSYYKFDSSAVYSRLVNALKHGSVVVCSTTPAKEDMRYYAEDRGILLNHAYTVTATATVERDEGIEESLIKLRNPWSHKEWTGPWGDHSADWYTVNEAQRLQLREIEDNGEFWMSWTEFWKIFTDLTVCSISPDYDSDGLGDGLDNVFCIYGKWKESQSGGWKNTANNPTYQFTVPPDSKPPVYILVESIQKLPPKVHKTTAGNILLKNLETSSMSSKYLGADTMTYTTANPITRRFEVKPGVKYHIIATKYQAGEKGSFLLRVFSKDRLKIKPVRQGKKSSNR